METRFLACKILLAAATAILFVFGVSAATAQITLGLPQAFATHKMGSTSLAAIDLDSDGDLDLVVANRVDSTLTLHLNDGAGTFTFHGSMTAGGTDPVSVIAVDLDGDFDLDLVVANKDSGLSIFRNNGGRGFISLRSDPPPLDVPGGPVTAADFNGDRGLDMAVANVVDGHVSIWVNGNDERVDIPSQFSCCEFATSVTAGDLDGDGKPDLAGAFVGFNAGGGDGLQVRLNRWNAQSGILFDTTPVDTVPGGGFRLKVADESPICKDVITSDDGSGDPEDCHTMVITAAHLNNDQRLDLAIANESTGIISIFLNLGNNNAGAPTFSRKDVSTGHDAPVFVIAADLDGDGLPDLVVVNRDSNSISVLRNNGGGTFAEAVNSPYLVELAPHSVIAKDLNGDGRLDLAVANSVSNSISVLLNRPPPPPPLFHRPLPPPADNADPTPDIRVNGSDGPLTVSSASTLDVTVALDPGGRTGMNADWWVAAETPFGFFFFIAVPGTWVSEQEAAHMGRLANMPVSPIFSGAGLPTGTYNLYFGVDLIMNGLLDMDALSYDVVNVTVQ